MTSAGQTAKSGSEKDAQYLKASATEKLYDLRQQGLTNDDSEPLWAQLTHVEAESVITEDEEMLSLIKIAQRNREIVAYNNKQRALRKKKRHNSGSTRDVDSSRHQAFREGFFVEEEVERPWLTDGSTGAASVGSTVLASLCSG